MLSDIKAKGQEESGASCRSSSNLGISRLLFGLSGEQLDRPQAIQQPELHRVTGSQARTDFLADWQFCQFPERHGVHTLAWGGTHGVKGVSQAGLAIHTT